jgi:MYXO-CTERM domain-containing protein
LGTAACNVVMTRSPAPSSSTAGAIGAAAAAASPLHRRRRFHRIVWNFPCVHSPLDDTTQTQRGRDGQNEEMEGNKEMLRAFFEHAVRLLVPGGEVHLVHKTKPPYNQWDLSELVAGSGMRMAAAVVFDRELYPGYTNRKALVGRGSFPISDARTFVFVSPLVLSPVGLPGTGLPDGPRPILGTLARKHPRCRLCPVPDALLVAVFEWLRKCKAAHRSGTEAPRVLWRGVAAAGHSIEGGSAGANGSRDGSDSSSSSSGSSSSSNDDRSRSSSVSPGRSPVRPNHKRPRPAL